jgi:hypothetical protein
VKIKDVIQESVYDFFTKGAAAQQQAASVAQDRQQTYRAAGQQQAAGQLKPNPARAAVQPQRQTQAGNQAQLTSVPGMNPGIKIWSWTPLVLIVDKQKYSLTDDGYWVRFGTTRQVDPTTTAILNREKDIIAQYEYQAK